ncbi:hypothetical protein F511_41038 [Dorcoceras hygrometricum]|uniref:Uncharacterized protein n=1 Tax=Dorcoceras hygrometricum TaxID=472368 RepID=A0A2Z7BZW2_9LAMI|nr:hypothetical protein F511_41038 [Dorcoceras hygrometricum]
MVVGARLAVSLNHLGSHKYWIRNSYMDTQLNVLSTRRGFREVRLPKSQQGSNRDLTLLRGKTVILLFGCSLTKESRIWSWIGLAYLPQSTEKSRVLETLVGARHKCQRDRKTKIGNRTPAAAVCGGAPSRTHARRATCALAAQGKRTLVDDLRTMGALAAHESGDAWRGERPPVAHHRRPCRTMSRVFARVVRHGRAYGCAREGWTSRLVALHAGGWPTAATAWLRRWWRCCAAHDGAGRAVVARALLRRRARISRWRRRPAAAPANFRRCRDGWSDSF